MKASASLLIVGGSAIFLIFAVLGFGGLDLIVHAVVRNMFVLKESSDVWSLWKTTPLPIYIRIWCFNITNPEGVSKGDKAVVQELGPYTYREDWEKVDVTCDEESDTIRYRMTKTYFFEPELSSGSEHDQITFINMVLLAASHIASDLLQDELMMTTLNDMLIAKGETLTKTGTVRGIFFDGVSVQNYVDLFKDPIVEDLSAEVGLELPEIIRDGVFAIFKHKNTTDDGWLKIKTGLGDSGEFAKIVGYNDEPLLKHWRHDTCNTINGTDATMFPPFLSRNAVVQMFAPQICRSFALEYHSDSQASGLHAYKFVGSDKNWMAPKSNPDNWCYCKPLQGKTELESCVHDGVFSIWPCSGGAPILLSQPHFYGAEDWIRNGVEGLSPEFEKHMTTMEFHPLTGTPIQVYARMQLGVELIPYPFMSLLTNARRAVIPLLWIEEDIRLDGANLLQLQLLDAFLTGFSYAKYIFMGAGVVMASIGLIILQEGRKGRKAGGGGGGIEDISLESKS